MWMSDFQLLILEGHLETTTHDFDSFQWIICPEKCQMDNFWLCFLCVHPRLQEFFLKESSSQSECELWPVDGLGFAADIVW